MPNDDDNPARSSRTPLNVLALFLALVEAIAGSTLAISSSLSDCQRSAIVAFVITFPILVLASFLTLLIFFHRNLYAPFEYRSDESFLTPLSGRAIRRKLIADAEALEGESASAPKPPEGAAAADNALVAGDAGQLAPPPYAAPQDPAPGDKDVDELGQTGGATPSPIVREAITRSAKLHAALVEIDQAEQYVIELVRSLTPHRVAADAALHGDRQRMGFDGIVSSRRGLKGVEVLVARSEWIRRDRILSVLDRASVTADTLTRRREGRVFSLFIVAVSLDADVDQPTLITPADVALLASRSFRTSIRCISMRKLRQMVSNADDSDPELLAWRAILEQDL